MSAISNLAVLGSTGSIGKSTLDVVARHPDRYRITALTANSQHELLFEQCKVFQPRFAVLLATPTVILGTMVGMAALMPGAGHLQPLPPGMAPPAVEDPAIMPPVSAQKPAPEGQPVRLLEPAGKPPE